MLQHVAGNLGRPSQFIRETREDSGEEGRTRAIGRQTFYEPLPSDDSAARSRTSPRRSGCQTAELSRVSHSVHLLARQPVYLRNVANRCFFFFLSQTACLSRPGPTCLEVLTFRRKTGLEKIEFDEAVQQKFWVFLLGLWRVSNVL